MLEKSNIVYLKNFELMAFDVHSSENAIYKINDRLVIFIEALEQLNPRK